MRYYLNINGEVSGPHSQFAVIDLIREGTITEQSWIWRQGYDEWLQAKNANEFDSYWPKTEIDPDLEPTHEVILSSPPSTPPIHQTTNERPRPWLRFWARMIDYMAYMGVAMFITMLIFPTGVLQKLMLASTSYIPVEALFILGYVPIEAWLLSRFGTTPGRALLRMNIRIAETGELLTYRQALIRSLEVYVKGVGLWLPLLSLFAMSWSRIQLLRHGRTSWDENCGTKVNCQELQPWRLVTLGVIIMLVALAAAIGFSVRPEVLEALRQQSQG